MNILDVLVLPDIPIQSRYYLKRSLSKIFMSCIRWGGALVTPAQWQVEQSTRRYTTCVEFSIFRLETYSPSARFVQASGIISAQIYVASDAPRCMSLFLFFPRQHNRHAYLRVQINAATRFSSSSAAPTSVFCTQLRRHITSGATDNELRFGMR
jgi:hypothetical protein